MVSFMKEGMPETKGLRKLSTNSEMRSVGLPLPDKKNIYSWPLVSQTTFLRVWVIRPRRRNARLRKSYAGCNPLTAFCNSMGVTRSTSLNMFFNIRQQVNMGLLLRILFTSTSPTLQGQIAVTLM